jgi:hypothetical protein
MNPSIFGRLPMVAALTIAMLTSLTPEASAQPARGQTTVTVWRDPAIATLLLVDRLPAPASTNSGAVVIRRPGQPPNNIILVTGTTLPRDLSRAVTALAFSRRNQGDSVLREMRTAVLASPQGASPATRDDRRAAADLGRVRLAPEFEIPGIARGRAIVVRMADSAVTKPAIPTNPMKPTNPAAPAKPPTPRSTMRR